MLPYFLMGAACFYVAVKAERRRRPIWHLMTILAAVFFIVALINS